MTNTTIIAKILRAGLLSSAAVALLSGAAVAGDLGEGSLKDTARPEFEITVNGGATTDYVSRGMSNSDNDAALFAGIEGAYKMFYIGAWGSSVDESISKGSVELDLYAGIKPKIRDIEFDFGFIYYLYPSYGDVIDPDYFELKAAASTKVLGDVTIGGTAWWTPNGGGDIGSTWTFEGKVSKPLPIAGLTASALLGHVTSEDKDENFSGGFGDDNYTYWNVGLSKTFREKYTFDVRYWNSDVDTAADNRRITGERVVGTFTFNY